MVSPFETNRSLGTNRFYAAPQSIPQEIKMDPISAAIIAGASAGLTGAASDVVQQAVVDAYTLLKNLLKHTFGGDSDLVEAVEKVEQRPDSEGRQKMIQEEVEAANATANEEITKAAMVLVEMLEETDVGKRTLGKFNIHAPGSQIGVIGDNAKVEQGIHFNTSTKDAD
jgi:hypothetical protein